MSNEPRRVPIHRSLNRPSLLMGGERELVLMTLLTAVMIAFTSSSWMQLLLAIAYWLVVHTLLVALARFDPHMSKIFARHVRYNAYYPARATECALPPSVSGWKV